MNSNQSKPVQLKIVPINRVKYSDAQEISDIVNNMLNTYGEDVVIETMKLFGFSVSRDKNAWEGKE
jgi:hypothetical protein